MTTRLLLSAVVVAAFSVMANPASAGNTNTSSRGQSAATVRGAAQDPSTPQLGEVEYLFNASGYHFWFTAGTDIAWYEKGNSYHNIYKYEVQDPNAWCGPVMIPNRVPYSAGGTAGASAYFKSWNVTTETWICGSQD